MTKPDYADLLAKRLEAVQAKALLAPICLDRDAYMDYRQAVADRDDEAIDAAAARLRDVMVHLELMPLSAAEFEALQARHLKASNSEQDRFLVVAAFRRAIDMDGEAIPAITAENLPALLEALTVGEMRLIVGPLVAAVGGEPDFPTF